MLSRLQATGVIDGTAKAIDNELLARILDVAPKAELDRPRFKGATFDMATGDYANFNSVIFGHGASFH
ncbi:MAG TPA: hypothetical protein VEL12_06995 [Candidatus Nitrosopolaris sp.]|nr:hypothetical protein [Candidatus Nitrosopolaris sp.]